MHPPKWNILALFFKKNLYFVKRKLFVYFLIFPDMEPALPTPITPLPPPPKKKNSSEKFLIFSEMELSSSNIKNNLIFSQKKAFHIFSQKKAFHVFLEMEPGYF